MLTSFKLGFFKIIFINRWDVIANFIEEHSRGKFKRTGKEVLNKTKEIDKGLGFSSFITK